MLQEVQFRIKFWTNCRSRLKSYNLPEGSMASAKEGEELFLLEVVIGTVQSDEDLLAACALPAISCRFLDFPSFTIHYFSTSMVDEIKQKAELHSLEGKALVSMVQSVLNIRPNKVRLHHCHVTSFTSQRSFLTAAGCIQSWQVVSISNATQCAAAPHRERTCVPDGA
jgi:hypothetical protein